MIRAQTFFVAEEGIESERSGSLRLLLSIPAQSSASRVCGNATQNGWAGRCFCHERVAGPSLRACPHGLPCPPLANERSFLEALNSFIEHGSYDIIFLCSKPILGVNSRLNSDPRLRQIAEVKLPPYALEKPNPSSGDVKNTGLGKRGFLAI